MSHAKNQHYVARLYLRQFACSTGGKNPHIYAFDKTDRRVIRPSIRNVAATIAVTSNGKGQGTTFTVRLSTIDDEHAAPLSDSRDTADRRLHRRAVE